MNALRLPNCGLFSLCAFLSIFLCAVATVLAEETKSVPVVEKNGKLCVSAAALAQTAEIAIKDLPAEKKLVACMNDRCVLVKELVREPGGLFIAVDSLAAALGATAVFDESRKNVAFQFKARDSSNVDDIARVGQLAPDFRLSKLDGTPVALSDFRGKRVLIDSWASW